ncbi:unnamed protein product [Soboliphyme baturini]|uniref:Uncharacterized protein n=1 Tax=Soboliphyme baturini TaxID=241478 RepID=A0A183IBU5_9BILA|nr:unnamed protein product [Soboliphyme baturini]
MAPTLFRGSRKSGSFPLDRSSGTNALSTSCGQKTIELSHPCPLPPKTHSGTGPFLGMNHPQTWQDLASQGRYRQLVFNLIFRMGFTHRAAAGFVKPCYDPEAVANEDDEDDGNDNDDVEWCDHRHQIILVGQQDRNDAGFCCC